MQLAWHCPSLRSQRATRHQLPVLVGTIGPLCVFGTTSIELFISYSATRSPRIFFPSSWTSWKIAGRLHKAAEVAITVLGSLCAKTAAPRTLEFHLRRFKLPPLHLRLLLLLLLRHVFGAIGQLRRCVFASFSLMRKPRAR